MVQVRDREPSALGESCFSFEDARLPELLFRYRARYYPETLDAGEQSQWEEYRFLRLTDPVAGAQLCMEQYQGIIDTLLADDTMAAGQRRLLQDLLDYGDSLLA